MNWILGEFDGFVKALIMFVVIDYITAFMVAFFQKILSAEKEFKEICKKLSIFCLVGVGHIIDAQVIGNDSVIRNAIILFYLSSEGISIIGNVSIIGIPIPKELIKILEQLYHEHESDEREK